MGLEEQILKLIKAWNDINDIAFTLKKIYFYRQKLRQYLFCKYIFGPNILSLLVVGLILKKIKQEMFLNDRKW